MIKSKLMSGLKKAALICIPVVLVGCETISLPSLSRGGTVAPALEVLALDYERTNFTKSSRVSGRIAKAQRDLLVSTPTTGRLRHEGLGPIPTEVRVTVTELVTTGRQVRMRGSLALRDLGFGTILAEKEDFSASGPLPLTMAGADPSGLVFRGVEDEILEWLGGLECDTEERRCGKPAPKPESVVPDEDKVTEGADLELAEMVGPRPSGLRGLNSGGIQADQVIAAAAPVEAEEAETAAAPKLVGTTIAALGLLDRSGFWLQTPLVKTESTGMIVDPATGKRLSVTLVPKDGPAGGGSQISLAAMNELGISMTSLISLEVYR